MLPMASCIFLTSQCFSGREEVSCTLTDLYLSHPHYFHVVEVLGPACMEIFGLKANMSSLLSELHNTGEHQATQCMHVP